MKDMKESNQQSSNEGVSQEKNSSKKAEMTHMDHMNHGDHDMSEMKHMNHGDHDMSEMKHMNHGDHDMTEMKHMNHSGHDMSEMDHSMHMGNFKQKFWLSLILAIPILIFSPMMGLSLPFQFTFTGSNWVVLVLATILFFYGGEPFFKGAKMELQMKNPGMMTLIAMGISVSYIYSVYAFVLNLLQPHTHTMDYFWELASLIVIMLLGHWVEMSAVSNASSALKKLAELLPDNVVKITSHGEEKISLKDVTTGDHLKVLAGDKVPADGFLLTGSTTVNEAALTGESRQVKKEKNAKVIGGSVNGSGSFTMEVTATGENGYLAQVMDLVKKAQQEKSHLETLSDKVAKWLFYVALIVGISAFIIWLFVADISTALERMVTVFVIACPHALGLAIPLVVARSTSIAAKNGLLLKKRAALEGGSTIDTIFLDKTGTLTEGNFTVQKFYSVTKAYSENDLLAFLGALEQNSTHPIATGLISYLEKQHITPFAAEKVENISGQGLTGLVKGKKVAVLNSKALGDKISKIPADILQEELEKGHTVSFLVMDDEVTALISLGDEVKENAQSFITALKNRQITPVMVTGDNEKAAKAVANYLGIEKFYGGFLPEDKEKLVTQFLQEGHDVMMVGDGINDAPSLAKANIGMAIGAGTDIAIESADVVLTNSNPEDILHFLDLAKATKKKMVENLWWGAGYNLITIPLAAGILAPLGILLNPALGAVLMSLSTVVVAINALLLHLEK